MAPPTSAPANLVVSAFDAITLAISWDPVANATSYRLSIFQKDDVTTVQTSYLWTLLDPSTTYLVVVAAQNAEGVGPNAFTYGTTPAIDNGGNGGPPPGPSVPTRPARQPQPSVIGGLGCGTYEAYLALRGGGILGQLDHTDLSFRRVLSATGDGSVSMSGISQLRRCAGLLADCEPWHNEVAVYRSGRLAWCGPVTTCAEPYGSATLQAQDLTAWFAKRFIHTDYDYSLSGIDLAVLWRLLALDALAPDPSPALSVLAAAAPVVVGQRFYYASDYQLASDALRELTTSGVDWTCLNRQVLLGGAQVPLAAGIPLLHDESFADPPEVILDGTNQVTRAVTKGGGQYPPLGIAGGPSARYGLLEASQQRDAALDDPSAQAASQTWLDESMQDGDYAGVGLVASGVLDPLASIPFDQLIPGKLVDVRLERAFPVHARYRLASVEVATPNAQERVTVGFIPVGSTG